MRRYVMIADTERLDVATSQICVPTKKKINNLRQALAATSRNLIFEQYLRNNSLHSNNSETVSVRPVYNTTIFPK